MNLSKSTREVIVECRKTAEKLENDYIGIHHFYLAYSKQAFADKYDFKLTLTQKKEMVSYLKGVKLAHRNDDLFPITKELERALRNGSFQRWVFRDKQIDPIHIVLARLSVDIKDKHVYLQALSEYGIKYGNFRRKMIYTQFNRPLRILGIAKLIRWVF
jgi:ATP-dependent Clp protease ATP-binding subunit ClpA